MVWSYRKRIKVIPGVHLNFSKSGITTSIGVRGANVTFGKKGAYLNTSVPGLRIYNRQKIADNDTNVPDSFNPNPTSTVELEDNIFSADIQEITSQDMRGIKDAIIMAHEQRNELKRDLVKIKTSLLLSRFKLFLSYLFIIGFLKKSIPENINIDIVAKNKAIEQLDKQIEKCYVDLDIDFDSDIKVKYDKAVAAFKNLCNSKKIWDVTSAQFEDRKVTRSAASTAVNKREVRFGLKGLEDIKSKFEVLWFKNANGADIYLYPTFVVMYSSLKSFALISLDELQFSHAPVRFVETGMVPRDSKIIDRTWAKVNKNGTPDRRFKGNYEIPVVRYGQINLKTNTGLNEEYEFSNYEYSEQFASAFLEFKGIANSLEQNRPNKN